MDYSFKGLLTFFWVMVYGTISAGTDSSDLSVTGLRCEYLNNPKGIDVVNPRLGWKLGTSETGRYGWKQTAYRVIVSSSKALLDGDTGDLWDSGWVASSAGNQVSYAGEPLVPDRSYYWKVRIKDQDQRTTAWSPPAQFTTGFFSTDQWKGQWIGDHQVFVPGGKDCNTWDPWFRKTFLLEEEPGRAFIYVASVGYHELYVNGVKVGDEILAPAVTDHTKRARYVAYDLSGYVRKGENVIGLWLGTSWSIFAPYLGVNNRPAKPIVTGQAFFYEDSHPGPDAQPFAEVLTGSSWKTHASPNKLLGTWDFRKMGGELWDGMAADPSWNQLGYNDTPWNHAVEYTPTFTISAQMVEPNRLLTAIAPKKSVQRADGSIRIDFGVNFAGWIEIPLTGSPGDSIKFFFSEREEEEMTFDMRSIHVLGKDGRGVFRNRFNYSSGRWVTIYGLEKAPQLQHIKGYLVRTDFESATTFRSSDTLMNWLYENVRWTFENLSLGGYIVDCPQRERAGYGGDAHATCETGMYNYQMGAFYTKWMQDWRDVQGTDGILPHSAPTYKGGGGPAWGGIVVTLPWLVYQYYGDSKILADNYALINGWLSFLDTHVEGDLLSRFGGEWDFLGDWLWPNATAEGMNNDKPETLFFNNAYRVYNLRTAAKIAGVLGRTADAKRWEQQAVAASTAIHRKFFNGRTNDYADGSMANLAMALLAEVVPRQQRPDVMKALEREILVDRKGHIHAGITGGAMLFKLLREAGRDDLIYSMVSKTDYPSWGYMKANDATTIWEMWEKNLAGHSLLHSSYLFPGAWFIDGLAGIKIGKPGFSEFIIQPPALRSTAVDWVEATYDSPAGLIEVGWRRQNDRLEMDIVVPPNTTALLKIRNEEKLRLKRYFPAIQQLADEGGMRVYWLPSGSYAF